MARPHVTFVIMAGGRGERLWPLVRERRPKVCLAPDGRRSLLRATIDRLKASWPGAGWLIITTKEQAPAIRAAVPPAIRRRVLVEPQGRNTAACITWAAAIVAAKDPDGVLVVLPADHWIGDVAAYQRAIRAGIKAAARGETIVTIGITPTFPHTGLGYLCAEPRSNGKAGILRLARSIEKPSLAKVRALLKRPRTYWNSGTFIGTADTLLTAIATWLPEHARLLVPAPKGKQLARAYARVPKISFDHGVMDHLREGWVVPGAFPWADLGTWDSWARLGRASAQTALVQSKNVSVVSLEPHLVATIGVSNLIVVHTPSATLICAADQAQDVREVVRQVQANPRLAGFR